MSERKQRGEVGPVLSRPGPPTCERAGPILGAERSRPASGSGRRHAEESRGVSQGTGAGGGPPRALVSPSPKKTC